jgi:hypothetical protein
VVTTTLGVPVENAVVRASSTKTDTTDSEGYFAITGLTAGSYTLTATKTGLTIQPDVAFFTNPVAVSPNKQNINFTAPPGTPYFATMKAGSLDAGSNTGAVIIPVSDADTPVTSLTFTGTSSNTAIVPNASITFGTIGTTVRTVTVAAGASVSGPVDITLTATDPEGGTASYVYPVTVNAKPVLSNLTGKSATENTPLDIDLRTLVPPDMPLVYESVARTGRLIVAAEDRNFAGFVRQIEGDCTEHFPGLPAKGLGQKYVPGIAQCLALEEATVLTWEDVHRAAHEIVAERVAAGRPVEVAPRYFLV